LIAFKFVTIAEAHLFNLLNLIFQIHFFNLINEFIY